MTTTQSLSTEIRLRIEQTFSTQASNTVKTWSERTTPSAIPPPHPSMIKNKTQLRATETRWPMMDVRTMASRSPVSIQAPRGWAARMAAALRTTA